jgi:hypothetical protein
VVAAPFRGDLGEAARRLRGKITNASGYQVLGGERAVTTQAGVHGRRGAYSSSGLLGQYAVFVHDGVSVEITMSGPEDRLASQAAWDDSLRSLAFDGPRS